MELLAVAGTWWLVSLSGVLMPGPVTAMAVGEGTRRGFIAGPLITLGHALAELAMLAALVAGMSRILQRPGVVGMIGLLGGVVLAWMGWGILATARRGDVEIAPTEVRAGGGALSLVRAGLLTTVGNPYWLLWWATVGASYFAVFSRFGPAALAGLYFVGHLSLDLGWNSFLALVVGAGRRRVPSGTLRGVLGGCGVFVIAMSLYFFYSGVTFLAR